MKYLRAYTPLLLSILKFIVIIAAIVTLIALNWKMWSKDRDQEREIQRLQVERDLQASENAKMIASNDKLRRRIDSLKRGSVEMIEEEARDNFGMVSEGETFYDFQSTLDKKTQ